MSSSEITAESIVQAAREHGFTLEPGNGRTLDVDDKVCCGVGAAALLLDPRLARTGDWRLARVLVETTLGESAANGLEYGFEGWLWGDAEDFSDPTTFRRYRSIGKAVAQAVGSEE